METSSTGILKEISDMFSQSVIYQAVFMNLPGGLNDPGLDLVILIGLFIVFLLIVFVAIMVIAIRSGKKKQVKKRRVQASGNAKKSGSQQKAGKRVSPKEARGKAENSYTPPKKESREPHEITDEDIDRLLMVKAREQARQKQLVQKTNELDRILNAIAEKNAEMTMLERETEAEARQKERNMSILEDKVSERFRVEGSEKDESSDMIKKMQEEDKKARMRELAERKKRRRK